MDVVTRARDLKNRAMDERDIGNWDDALALLGEAEKGLRDALEDLKKRADKDSKLLEFETLVNKQLYQVLGSIGGIYRRRAASDDQRPGDLEAAIRSYDEGLKIESRFTDSYNLTQRLVTRVLLQPGALSDEAAKVEDTELLKALRDARIKIAEQTSETGPRNKDEYAFADAAIVAVLLGEQGWMDTVREFTRRAPKSSYARTATLDVLAELAGGAGRGGAAAEPLHARVNDAVRMASA